MNYIDIKTNIEIKIKDLSPRKLEALQKEAGVMRPESLDTEEAKKVLKVVVNKYKTGSYSLDDLSAVCNYLYNAINKNTEEISSDLEIGADLSYYERMAPNDKSINTEFVGYLKSVLKYGAE